MHSYGTMAGLPTHQLAILLLWQISLLLEAASTRDRTIMLVDILLGLSIIHSQTWIICTHTDWIGLVGQGI